METTPPEHPLRVLLVEDNPDDAELNLRALRRGGFRVQSLRVDTAEAMIEALAEQTWDIVLADFQIPGFGGMEALRVLQASQRDIPFIIISGAIGEEIAVSVMQAGAHDYVFKGNLARLCPAVERELKDARTRQEEQQAQGRLQETEARYRDLFEHSPTPTWIEDFSGVKPLFEEYQANGVTDLRAHFKVHPEELRRCAKALRILEISESSLSFFGVARKEDLPLDPSAFFEEASWPMFLEEMITLAQGGLTFQNEGPIRDCLGRLKIVSLRGSVSPGFETSLGRVLVSFMDVTDRVLARDALRESQASLERAQTIAQLGNWEWDLAQKHPRWSPQLFQIFGLDPVQGAPEYDHFIEMVHPEDRPEVLGAIECVIATGEPWRADYRIRTPDGQLRHVRERAERVPLEEGGKARLRGTIQDITERRRMEGALEDMGRLSAKGQMAAYIAHEINNPLAGIKNAFELLERAVPPDHPYAHFADLIKREIDRIAGIIRTMYHVYRPPTQELQEVSLLQAFQDIETLLLPRCRACGVETSLALQDPGIKLCMNEGLLRQLLFNLVQNALEASPRGSTVTLGASRQAGKGFITVQDEGPGIPPELADRIFEPGFTTKQGSSMSGLGLGLYTCRSIMESMEGTLQFSPGPKGSGTIFTAVLPLGGAKGIHT